MNESEYNRLCRHIAILNEIVVEYSDKTINNIITQMESRKKEYEKQKQQ